MQFMIYPPDLENQEWRVFFKGKLEEFQTHTWYVEISSRFNERESITGAHGACGYDGENFWLHGYTVAYNPSNLKLFLLDHGIEIASNEDDFFRNIKRWA